MTIFFVAIWTQATAFAFGTLFTYMGNESVEDERNNYDKRLLELALEKTVAEYGPFAMVPTSKGINLSRIIKLAEANHFNNFFFKFSVTDEMLSKFLSIQIPIDRGVVGYRIAFVHQQNQYAFANVNSLKSLTDYSIIQGIGWLDTQILHHNKLSVFQVSNYNSMFAMVERKRVDLFFRGINEITHEFDDFSIAYNNLRIEPHLLLVYPLPRFFMTSKDNGKNAERVELGLKRAWQDGSFVALWREHHLASIKKVNLSERKIIRLDNPFIKTLPSNYTQYNFTIDELITEPKANKN
ncbi:hypothetical protein DS2_03200 [Catenovulum agarivorans DS-2]|uniref:Solute-binding protein family 3/N-terminal domain-containing protein n=1 Tax=Catenovulum agarivorans DS-2 TaxID=1328313 RepID=W7QR59_9ALTE|nr:hypothetical protein DS2_03200 [Catenovulum agarivorans DS-2]